MKMRYPISLISSGVILYAAVVAIADEKAENSVESEQKRLLGLRRCGRMGGCGGVSTASVQDASQFQLQPHAMGKGGFLQQRSFAVPEVETMAEVMPIVIPIALSAAAAAPAAAPALGPAAAPAFAMEPIVIETVLGPSTQSEEASPFKQAMLLQKNSDRLDSESSFGQQLLLQKLSDRLDSKQNQPMNFQFSLPPQLLASNAYSLNPGTQAAAPAATYIQAAAAPAQTYAAAPLAAAPAQTYAAAPVAAAPLGTPMYAAAPMVQAAYSTGKSY